MNNIWYKATLLGLILMFIFAPYAGFAPLILVDLIASIYWFLTSIVKVLIFGEQEIIDYKDEAKE